MNRCPLCVDETCEPPRGVPRGVMLCTGCEALDPVERFGRASKIILRGATSPERYEVLARLLAREGVDQIARLTALSSDQAAAPKIAERVYEKATAAAGETPDERAARKARSALARDEAAPAAIRAWCVERVRRGKNSEKDPQIQEALSCAAAMEQERQEGQLRAVRALQGAPLDGCGDDQCDDCYPK